MIHTAKTETRTIKTLRFTPSSKQEFLLSSERNLFFLLLRASFRLIYRPDTTFRVAKETQLVPLDPNEHLTHPIGSGLKANRRRPTRLIW